MPVRFFLLFFTLTTQLFGAEYFQYEFNYKEEHKKLTIMPSGKYEYITYGVASGCFDFNGKKVGKFKNFNFKQLYELIKKNSIKSANISKAMFVKKSGVEIFGLKSKAMDEVHKLLFEVAISGEKSEGVGLSAKRLNDKKIKVSFFNVGEKKKEIFLSKDLNRVFLVKGVEFESQKFEKTLIVDKKNKLSSITLEAKNKIPKNEVLRYFDSVALLENKKKGVFNNTHLCSSI